MSKPKTVKREIRPLFHGETLYVIQVIFPLHEKEKAFLLFDAAKATNPQSCEMCICQEVTSR